MIFPSDERTPGLIISAAILIFALLTYAAWNFPWVKQAQSRRVIAIATLAVLVIAVGSRVYPHPNPMFQFSGSWLSLARPGTLQLGSCGRPGPCQVVLGVETRNNDGPAEVALSTWEISRPKSSFRATAQTIGEAETILAGIVSKGGAPFAPYGDAPGRAFLVPGPVLSREDFKRFPQHPIDFVFVVDLRIRRNDGVSKIHYCMVYTGEAPLTCAAALEDARQNPTL